MNEDVELTEAHIVVQEDELSQSVIETELHRLETVLKLYFRKKYKLELCLKLKYGDSLRKWINRKEEEIIEKMNIFHKHPIYHKKSLRMLFQVYFDQIMYSDNN